MLSISSINELCFERFQRCFYFERIFVGPDVGELMPNNSHGVAMKYEALLNVTG